MHKKAKKKHISLTPLTLCINQIFSKNIILNDIQYILHPTHSFQTEQTQRCSPEVRFNPIKAGGGRGRLAPPPL